MKLAIKRVYEPKSEGDGRRILIDRLWPRGLTRDKADVDLWLKDIAPSPGLRKWFGHDPAKWNEFRRRYLAEIGANAEALAALEKALGDGPSTLLYGAKDEHHNHAVVLRDLLAGQG
jgi:uncharacterized protein YeaO (DUF488 family)